MNLFEKLFKEKKNIQPVKDTIVEYPNGVKVNFSLLGRVIAAKKETNQISYFPKTII